ncbi:hypothetical protein BESB_078980 [Besnoitia besnoiti]|uniref:Transmembrane protein n=1 Tax=Besnoitia besnoiti TaxID=94643 RepID=A0A2A9ME70_BESBE|nr:hypothetical protein BESB_078980 [Besnoitia besnoiti]PFH33682.1 hypothetical protein BESB_078980 [Besnoitia besnoiti]
MARRKDSAGMAARSSRGKSSVWQRGAAGISVSLVVCSFLASLWAAYVAQCDALDLSKLDPPLPQADYSLVIPPSDLDAIGRHVQYLLPNQRFMIVLESPRAVRVWPRNVLFEVYDVDDGICDVVSLKSLKYLFKKAPANYVYWHVTEHALPGVPDPVKSLVFVAPPPGSSGGDTEEFCVVMREKQGFGEVSVVIMTGRGSGAQGAVVLLSVGLLPIVASVFAL